MHVPDPHPQPPPVVSGGDLLNPSSPPPSSEEALHHLLAPDSHLSLPLTDLQTPLKQSKHPPRANSASAPEECVLF